MLRRKDWFRRAAGALTLRTPRFPSHAMIRPIRYKGYEMAPAAARQPNGLFAANLTIERTTAGPPRAYSFDAIDFFFDEAHALAYASRWGRIWIDDHS
ncbi:hypothetical protein bpln_2g06270 [Burkholderia plantarii]|nr:hypothetical protein bpln_2g06270 [Burkholderia plantarii]